jgi:hypothetical protein
MNEWALPTIALLLIGYGAVSARLQTTMVSQAMVFTAAGLLVGSWALDLVDVDAANQFVRHLAEATLALVLFTDAVGVNPGRLRRESLVPARLLGVGLPSPSWPAPWAASPLPERPLMLAVVTWTVALSVYAHGLTAYPGANRYADWYAAHARDHAAMPESAPVAEQHLRDRTLTNRERT